MPVPRSLIGRHEAEIARTCQLLSCGGADARETGKGRRGGRGEVRAHAERRGGHVAKVWGGPHENARSPALQLMHELGELVAPLGRGARVLAGLPHGVCRDGAEGTKRASQRGLEGRELKAIFRAVHLDGVTAPRLELRFHLAYGCTIELVALVVKEDELA